MNAETENKLWSMLPALGSNGPSARMAIEDLLTRGIIQNRKQAWRTLEKWARRGKYDYGVTLDLGWKT